MQFKIVVVAMSVLGLISCPTLAANPAKHYSLEKNSQKENYKGEEVGYKGELTCPRFSPHTPILMAMSQNTGRAVATVDCDKPIQFAGGLNFDTQWGNLSEGYMGENNTRISVNDAYLNATGHVNEWVNAFLEISYNNVESSPLNGALTGPGFLITPDPRPGLYSQAYNLESISLQQGYITIGDVDRFPLFLKLGKQFQDYGRYVIHPITRSMTQVMTETLQTSAELSFISGGNGMDLHGSLFVFENPMGKVHSGAAITDSGHKVANYGGQIGLGGLNNQLGWDLGIGYIYDITGVNDIAYAVTNFHNGGIATVGIDQAEGGYEDRVGGLTVYGMVNSGPFELSGHYATALKHFDSVDLGFAGNGAQPWSFDLQAGYSFNYWEKDQNLYVGYQHSDEASELYLPKNRWLAGLGIDMWKNTNVGIEYSYDDDYSVSDNGSGENSNRLALRVGVKFG